VIQNFKLINKKKLTYNIYELVFNAENRFNFKAWQFITFIIPVWGRAYSILEENWNEFKLIIKKRESEEWWRWWSKYLCELGIWAIIKWVWPAGHFTLKENDKNKLFLWTGTWFVPLYNQIIYWLKNNFNCNFKIIFWARTKDDLFYIEELENLKSKYNNFDFEIYLSREKIDWINNWYITDFINKNTKKYFEEIYICWAPGMIDNAIEILEKNWIEKNNIFTEKY